MYFPHEPPYGHAAHAQLASCFLLREQKSILGRLLLPQNMPSLQQTLHRYSFDVVQPSVDGQHGLQQGTCGRVPVY
jgi:hypothetical protein